MEEDENESDVEKEGRIQRKTGTFISSNCNLCMTLFPEGAAFYLYMLLNFCKKRVSSKYFLFPCSQRLLKGN